MNIKQKLRHYCKYKNLSLRRFAAIIGVSDSFLRTNGSISSHLLPIIKDRFLDLNMDWLVYDNGDMLLVSKPEDFTADLEKRMKKHFVTSQLRPIKLNNPL